MSVRCPDCGEGAGYGREIGHKSDCPSLRLPPPLMNHQHRDWPAKGAPSVRPTADILARLRHMEKSQGEDYIWRTAKTAADEIEQLRAALTKIIDLIDSEADDPLDDAITIAKRALSQNPT